MSYGNQVFGTEDPIISVKEARKLLGQFGKTLTDEQIKELILDLDMLASQSVKYLNEDKNTGSSNQVSRLKE